MSTNSAVRASVEETPRKPLREAKSYMRRRQPAGLGYILLVRQLPDWSVLTLQPSPNCGHKTTQ